MMVFRVSLLTAALILLTPFTPAWTQAGLLGRVTRLAPTELAVGKPLAEGAYEIEAGKY
jgi:hypothetical protein